MTTPASGIWRIIEAYLAGSESFDHAATRLANVLRAEEQGLQTASKGGDNNSLRGGMVWIPLETVPEADQPRVTRLFQRAFELSEETMTDDDEAAVIEALSRDLKSWHLDRYLHLVTDEARQARQYVSDKEQFLEKVVNDVQQDILDQFIDTTWPRCPRHFRHPLWFHDGAWFCDQDKVEIAGLGELSAPPPDELPWRLSSSPRKPGGAA